MKRFTSLALVTFVALVVTGLAIAHERQARKTEAVAATFTAAATGTTSTKQCAGADGTHVVTRASYEGTSTGDARLTGKIRIRIKSVVNTTNGFGWTEGSFTISDTATGARKAKAGFVAVNSATRTLNGFATGRVKDAGALLANFTASIAATGSPLTGELGSGAAQNTAIVTSGGCPRDDKKHDEYKQRDDD